MISNCISVTFGERDADSVNFLDGNHWIFVEISSRTMFRTSMMLRFHHLYVIQTLIEFQRQFNAWYSKLKHKFSFLLHKKLLQLNGVKSRLTNNGRVASCSDDHNYEAYNETQAQHTIKSNLRGQFLTDLNQMLAHSANLNSVSIPVQMLLLPFIPVSAEEGFNQAAVATRACNINSNDNRKCTAQHLTIGVHRTHTSHGSKNIMALDQLNGAQNESPPLPAVSSYRSFVMSEQTRRHALTSSNFQNHYQQQQQQTKPFPWFAGSRQASMSGISRMNSCRVSLRNPLVCFPSTSNHAGGHVKYM